MDKTGITKLGYVYNLKKSEKGGNCFSILDNIAGNVVPPKVINDYIDSDEFKVVYYNESGEISDESHAFILKFELPVTTKRGDKIFGVFSRNKLTDPFNGVFWKVSICSIGRINPKCFERVKDLTGQSLTTDNLDNFVVGELEYFNGAGHTKFPDGTKVNAKTGKFARFKLSLKTSAGDVMYGWFTKNIKGQYEGLNWGTDIEFRSMRKERERFFIGRMAFDSLETCNDFLKKLEEKTIKEPWEYKNRKDETFIFPILKSYLEFELERLFYEHEMLNYKDKIVYNNNKTKVLFNTNLIDKFGHDLNITGDLLNMGGKEYVANLEMSPSKLGLKKMGFNSCEPAPPQFFKDINEIIFHCEWEVDSNLQKYEHIIEERIERFPDKYKDLELDDLGAKLDNAIIFAKRIAQRNYKFIVPMYYPSAKRIQLLMPIYLESSYTSSPDFALVLTPHADEHIYTPETILGLDEVYQDARLIAKPEESWLNPLLIK